MTLTSVSKKMFLPRDLSAPHATQRPSRYWLVLAECYRPRRLQVKEEGHSVFFHLAIDLGLVVRDFNLFGDVAKNWMQSTYCRTST